MNGIVQREQKNGISAFDVRRFLELNKPDQKKRGHVKDISKVLSDIEEIRRSRKLVHFSELYKKEVYDQKDRKVGYLKDLSISGGVQFPEVADMLIVGKHEFMVPWKEVAELGDYIILRRPFIPLQEKSIPESAILLGRHILDKQVVDVNGMKIVRVNDIALTSMKSKLTVVSIDVGTKALFRRLGWQRFMDLLPLGLRDLPIPWSSIQPLSMSLEKIRLTVPCADISQLHPADIADLFEELSLQERTRILRSMKSETAAQVLLECEPEVQRAIMRTLTIRRIAAILEKMPANDAANLISEYAEVNTDAILHATSPGTTAKIRFMLGYAENAVARYMSHTFVTAHPQATVAETLERIRQLDRTTLELHYLYVVDESNRLKGIMSLKELVVSQPEKKMSDIMIAQVVSITSTNPIEYAEELMSKYDLLSLPVVDSEGMIAGVINAQEVLEEVMRRTRQHEPFVLTDQAKEDLEKEHTDIKYQGKFTKEIDRILQEIRI